MAGRLAMLAVPGAHPPVQHVGPALGVQVARSDDTPTSTTVTEAPAWAAKALIAAPPAAIDRTMAPVISLGQALAPSATTPWSPANTTTAGCVGTPAGTARDAGDA